MSDWMFETGGESLPLTLPPPSWASENPASWFEPLSADPGLDDFGPMFSATSSTASIIDDVIVHGTRNTGGNYDASWYDWDGYDTNDPYLPQPTPEDPRPEFQGEDCATESITAEINAKPTNNTAEHSAAV